MRQNERELRQTFCQIGRLMHKKGFICAHHKPADK